MLIHAWGIHNKTALPSVIQNIYDLKIIPVYVIIKPEYRITEILTVQIYFKRLEIKLYHILKPGFKNSGVILITGVCKYKTSPLKYGWICEYKIVIPLNKYSTAGH